MLKLARLVRRFNGDVRGVSAVEFAFIAPIMIALYFALGELCQGMFAERRASHVAAAVGDLITQSPSVTTDNLDDIFRIGVTIMQPFATTSLKMCASSISANATTGALKIDWVKNASTGGPSKTCKDTTDFPTQSSGKPFINPGESVVLSRAEYTYVSPVAIMVPTPITFKETWYLRPRKSTNVTCIVSGTGAACPAT